MKVLLGVGGGVAAYKAAELARALGKAGVEVQVAMTRAAERFVTPLTFAALTGKPVYTSLWQPSGAVEDGAVEDSAAGEFAIEHIAVAQAVDAVVVAPATADLLAKFAHGLADDFLSTLYLAATVPVVVAPAMNVNMWEHPATAANVRVLRERGVQFVEPDAGYLACGMTGAGRLAPVEDICAAVLRVLASFGSSGSKDLAGETVLVTAGGTREPIDPVRFLGNRSSGRMGYALAEAAMARGARVILVTAAALPDPAGCTVVRVTTAAEMAVAVFAHLPEATVVIGAAAVADFRVRTVAASKLRRSGEMTLALEPTEDILAEVVRRRRAETLVVAFAAETARGDRHVLELQARAKLQRKGADAIVANDVSLAGLGFESERNAGLFLTQDRTVVLAEMAKRAMAVRVLDEVVRLRVEVMPELTHASGV